MRERTLTLESTRVCMDGLKWVVCTEQTQWQNWIAKTNGPTVCMQTFRCTKPPPPPIIITHQSSPSALTRKFPHLTTEVSIPSLLKDSISQLYSSNRSVITDCFSLFASPFSSINIWVVFLPFLCCPSGAHTVVFDDRLEFNTTLSTFYQTYFFETYIVAIFTFLLLTVWRPHISVMSHYNLCLPRNALKL